MPVFKPFDMEKVLLLLLEERIRKAKRSVMFYNDDPDLGPIAKDNLLMWEKVKSRALTVFYSQAGTRDLSSS
jgi:hypothetical protein